MNYAPNATTKLADLHAYQASPHGMIEGHVAGLFSTIADLKSLSESPPGLRLLAAELRHLQLAQDEIGTLISRGQRRAQGIAV
jgi:hypothetical protein